MLHYLPIGECYAGKSSSDQYYRHGPGESKDCLGTDMDDCNGRKFCAGKEWHNMVYKIVGRYQSYGEHKEYEER